MLCANYHNRGTSVCKNSLPMSRERLEREVLSLVEDDLLSPPSLSQIIESVTARVKEQTVRLSRAALEEQVREADETLAWLKTGENPPAPIKAQIGEWEKRRERLLRDLQDAPGDADASAEAEVARVRDLLERVLNPTVLRLRNLVTGKKEPITIRHTRSLVQLLYSRPEESRTVLSSLIESIILDPIGKPGRWTGAALKIKGDLGNAVKEKVPPSSDGTYRTTGSGGRI